MQSNASFRYSSIDGHQVRLLQLHQATEVVTCSLTTHAFATVPEFYALSYVWGNSTASESIICNSDTLAVTPHLKNGLQTLYSRFGPQTLFWIDAICINQADDVEKAAQVPMMSRIYSAAQTVVIWFGPAADDSDVFFDNIGMLNDLCSKVDNMELVNEHTLTSYNLPPLTDPVWPALMKFIMRRDWFWRVWVVQEAAMARAILVLCGDRQISFDDLVCCVNYIRLATIFDKILAHYKISIDGPDHGGSTISILAIIRERLSDGREISITALLELARRKLAAEPVDRIYGLSSLMSQALQQKIKIDYGDTARREFWRLYIEVGAALIEEYGLVILDMAPSKTRCPELPSWCPDFRSPASVNSMGQVFAAGLADTDDDISEMPEIVVRMPGSSALGFRGLEMDSVDVVLPLTQRAIYNKEANKLAASILVECETACASLARSVYNSPDATPIQHKYTLVRGMLVHTNLYNVSEVTKDYGIATKWYRDLCDPTLSDVQLEKDDLLSAQRYTSAMSVAWEGTCYFSTKGGRVGLGPVGLLPGDAICIFFGAHVPHILRSNSDRALYELVGPAFVCGLMTGAPFYAANPIQTYRTFTIG